MDEWLIMEISDPVSSKQRSITIERGSPGSSYFTIFIVVVGRIIFSSSVSAPFYWLLHFFPNMGDKPATVR